MFSSLNISFHNHNKFNRNYSTLVTFVRHAQSAGNAKRPIFFSYSHYPITELGECQAEKFASLYGTNNCAHLFFDQIKSQAKSVQLNSTQLKIIDDNIYETNIRDDLDLIISSPFRRTIDTSKYLLKKYPKSEFKIDNRLSAFTYLDKPYYRSLRYSREKAIQNYWSKLDPCLINGKEAESFKNFYERTISLFCYILESGESWKLKQLNNINLKNKSIRIRNIVCFTHAMSCRMLELLKLGLLPCNPEKSILNDSFKLLKFLKLRKNGVSIQEAKEAMKIYSNYRKKRSVDNCESISCLL